MGLRSSLGISSASPDSASTITLEQSSRNIHLDHPPVGAGVLEGRPETEVSGPAISDSQSSSSSDGCNEEHSPSRCSKLTLGGLEGTGWTRITATWPKEDIELLESSWRKSSLKTYAAPWKTWVTRCRQLHLDPNDPDPARVAQHLSYLHRVKQFSPGTIKLHKSVISVLANPLKREEISSHPLVKHMIKAIEISRPPSTRRCIWDIEQMVLWLKSKVVNENSLFEVSRHVALILLLASGRRIHDLTLLRIDEMNRTSGFGNKLSPWKYKVRGCFVKKGE